MQKELLIKKLKYRSSYRGCKETDSLLGRFFEENYQDFNDDELAVYQHFIEEDDMLIYDWILDKAEFPSKYIELIQKIREFHDI